MTQAYSVFLETNLVSDKENRNFYFTNPVEILEAFTLSEAESILRKIDTLIKKKYYLAGYISYEVGYLFEENFKKKWEDKRFDQPIIWFGVYNFPKIQLESNSKTKNSFSIQNIFLDLDYKIYEDKILRIRKLIESGETYQVNFTFRMNFDFEGDTNSLYEALKSTQKVAYSAYIHDGRRQILSLSPELFFRRNKNQIQTKPMKGTSPRGKSKLDDSAIIQALKMDNKTKAENSMIVDLIRNDLGKISEIGSVKVEKLLEVEEYETLFQMTSTITANLKASINYFDLFKAIFPGGSVTGAPKYKTMQIIEDLETSQRGVYTGAIGFISEDEAIFNIPIRTIEIQNKKGKMGIGSGVVWDSTAFKEYEECILKQRFFLNAIPFYLIESILIKNENWVLLDFHLNRLEKSANFFGFLFEKEKIIQSLHDLKLEITNKNSFSRFKVRLSLSRDGVTTLEYSNILRSKNKYGKIKISPNRIHSNNIFQQHKTSNRKLYDEEYKRATSQGLQDFIFLNEKEEIVEGSIYNLFIKKEKVFLTPSLSSGALPGIMRAYLLKKGKIKEKTLTFEDIKSAEAIYLCNSVRGIIRVSLIEALN